MRILSPIKYFFVAVVSFTRIPLPHWFEFEKIDVSKSMMFFPFVGALIGFICWIVWYLLRPFLPQEFLALLLLVIPIVLTGAYHEDGFADTCDSYGGYTKETRLEIMKDSRIGAFGAIGITLLLLAKFLLLKETKIELLPLAIISAMILGRLCVMLPIKLYPYVGKNSGTAALLKFNYNILLIALVISGLFLVPLLGVKVALLLFVVVQVLVLLSGAYFKHRYGGLTGDPGGAMEQIGEAIAYLFFMLISYGTLHI